MCGEGAGQAINGVAQLGGAYLGAEADKDVANIQNETKQTEINPYQEAFMTRMFGILDSYISRHGVAAFIPPDRLPYELRTPEQREQIRNQIATAEQNGQPLPGRDNMPPPPLYTATHPAGSPPKPKPTEGAPVDPQMEISQPRGLAGQLAQTIGAKNSAFGEPNGYTDAALAAQLGARRMGITQETPMFATTRDFHEQDQKRKQEELNKLNEYIYGQRKIGV